MMSITKYLFLEWGIHGKTQKSGSLLRLPLIPRMDHQEREPANPAKTDSRFPLVLQEVTISNISKIKQMCCRWGIVCFHSPER